MLYYYTCMNAWQLDDFRLFSPHCSRTFLKAPDIYANIIILYHCITAIQTVLFHCYRFNIHISGPATL